ncbi:MAG: hypothetical protein IJ265_00410 [Oscillospiraceae bacterium]|nr:hypothetical protein [Oscillospiraceae bacterium]
MLTLIMLSNTITETTTTTTEVTTTTTKATTTTTEATTTTTKATTTTTEATTTTTEATTTTTEATTTTATTTSTMDISYGSDQESFDAVIGVPETEDPTPIEIITNGLRALFDENAVLAMQEQHAAQKITLRYQIITEAQTNEQQEAVEEILNDGGKVFDLSLVDENGDSVQFSNDEAAGTVTITLPYKAASSDSKITVYYIAPDGTRTDVNADYHFDDEMITFTVSHFSVYAITEEVPVETTYTETASDTTTTTTSTETATTETDDTTAPSATDMEETTTAHTDLPQTGTNAVQMMLIVFGAVLLIGTGFWMILVSGAIRRKEK